MNNFHSNTNLVDILRDLNLTICTAESCTGGLLGSIITDVCGSSDVYEGGVIAYSNEQKVKQIGVSQTVLDRFTEVSAEAAREMALGVRKNYDTSIGLSTTGFLDLDEGHPLVYCCIDSEIGSEVFTLNSDYLIKLPERFILKKRVCDFIIDKAYSHAQKLL